MLYQDVRSIYSWWFKYKGRYGKTRKKITTGKFMFLKTWKTPKSIYADGQQKEHAAAVSSITDREQQLFNDDTNPMQLTVSEYFTVNESISPYLMLSVQ